MKSRSIIDFSLIYLVPQLISYYSENLPFPSKFLMFVFLFVCSTIILLIASGEFVKTNQSISIYFAPLTVVLLSYLLLIIGCSIAGLAAGGLAGVAASIPRILAQLLLSIGTSTLPILFSMILIFFVRYRNKRSNIHDDIIDSEYLK